MKRSARNLPEDAQDIILNTISCGVFTVDTDWKISSFNRAVSELTGIPEAEALGRPCREVLRGDICAGNCALRETLATGNPIVNRPFELIDVKGRRRPVSISTAVFRDRNGTILGGLESIRDLTTIEQLKKEISRSYCLNDIISRNHRMGRIFEILPKIARTTSTILIEGESGTGKELTARAIHSLSSRKSGPFIALNCTALPDTLLESKLFGYKKGAFTDARTDKKGRVALAEGGTLFLDEIGDVSPAFQTKLLRFLQDRTYQPLGGQRLLVADVRILAASNRDLADLVRSGAFREDLYYRINVIRIELPPLRSRLEDVPLLADHFIRRLNALMGKDIKEISHDALSILMEHSYPGNVRELENILEHAAVLCEGPVILPMHLPETLKIPGAGSGGSNRGGDARAAFRRLEASFLSSLLAAHGNDCAETAEALGIHKATLYRRLRKLGIQPPLRRSQKSRNCD